MKPASYEAGCFLEMEKMKLCVWKTGAITLMLSINIAWADTSGADTTVLMKYQDAIVTKADLDAEMRRIPEENRVEVLASKVRIDKLLESLMLNRVFSSEARKIGMDKNPLFVNELKLAEDRLLARDFLDAQLKQLKLPDFEARANELYRANPEKYTIKQMVDASHILVAIKDGKKDEALKQANDLYNQLLAGASFDDLATTHSDDKSAKRNAGRLGYFAAGQMVKEFSDAAFALEKAGDISKPVESKFGYHIIKLHGKKGGQLQDYAAVKDGIIESLKRDYLATARKDLINSVRASSDLQINEAEIEKLKTKLPYISNPEGGAAGNEK